MIDIEKLGTDGRPCHSLSLPAKGLVLIHCSKEDRDSLVHAICLRKKTSSYSCRFDETDLSDLSSSEKQDFVFHNISIVNCSDSWNWQWTLEENLLLALGEQKNEFGSSSDIIQKTLQKLGLAGMRNSAVAKLSPSQRILAQFARAFVRQTPLNIVLNAFELCENEILRSEVHKRKNSSLFLVFTEADISLGDVDFEVRMTSKQCLVMNKIDPLCFENSFRLPLLPKRKAASALRHLKRYLPHSCLTLAFFGFFVLLSSFLGFSITYQTRDDSKIKNDYFARNYKEPVMDLNINSIEETKNLYDIPGIIGTPSIQQGVARVRLDDSWSSSINLFLPGLRSICQLDAGTFPYDQHDIVMTKEQYMVLTDNGYRNPLTGERFSNPSMDFLIGKPIEIVSGTRRYYPHICGFINFSRLRYDASSDMNSMSPILDAAYISPSFYEFMLDNRMPIQFTTTLPGSPILKNDKTKESVCLEYTEGYPFITPFSSSYYGNLFFNQGKNNLGKNEILIPYYYFLDYLTDDKTEVFVIPGSYHPSHQDFVIRATPRHFFAEILRDNAIDLISTKDAIDYAFSNCPKAMAPNISEYYQNQGAETPETIPDEDKRVIFQDYLQDEFLYITYYGSLSNPFFSDKLAEIYFQTVIANFRNHSTFWTDGTWKVEKDNDYVPGKELLVVGFTLDERSRLTIGKENYSEMDLFPFQGNTILTPTDEESLLRVLDIDTGFQFDGYDWYDYDDSLQRILSLSPYWFPYLSIIVVGVLLWQISLAWIQNRDRLPIDRVYRTRPQRTLLLGLSAALPSLCALALSTALWGISLAIFNAVSAVRLFVTGYDLLVLFLASLIPLLGLWPCLTGKKTKKK